MINFKDVTFIVPVRFDSEDRKTNFTISMNYLLRNFDTTIIVMESDKISHKEFVESISKEIIYVFEENKDKLFHRTKLLNEMTKMTTTNLIVNYDVDVLFPIQQYIDSKQQIIDGDMLSFPYDGHFYDIKKEYFNLIQEDKLAEIDLNSCICFNPHSWGGAFFFNKEKYWSIGLENEKFISWGHEDWERIVRVEKLGHTIGRTEGNLYHLTHSRNFNSSDQNPYYKYNGEEFHKINQMDKDTLLNYIKTWKWV